MQTKSRQSTVTCRQRAGKARLHAGKEGKEGKEDKERKPIPNMTLFNINDLIIFYNLKAGNESIGDRSLSSRLTVPCNVHTKFFLVKDIDTVCHTVKLELMWMSTRGAIVDSFINRFTNIKGTMYSFDVINNMITIDPENTKLRKSIPSSYSYNGYSRTDVQPPIGAVLIKASSF